MKMREGRSGQVRDLTIVEMCCMMCYMMCYVTFFIEGRK